MREGNGGGKGTGGKIKVDCRREKGEGQRKMAGEVGGLLRPGRLPASRTAWGSP